MKLGFIYWENYTATYHRTRSYAAFPQPRKKYSILIASNSRGLLFRWWANMCVSYKPISLLPSSTDFCVLFAVKSQAAGKPIESKRISLQKMAISWVHGYKKGSQKYLTHLLYILLLSIRCCFQINICQWVCWWLIDSWWRLRNYQVVSLHRMNPAFSEVVTRLKALHSKQ